MLYRLRNAISHIAYAGSASLMSFLGTGFITVLLATLLLNHAFIFQQSEFINHGPTLIAFLKETVNESKGRTLVSQIEKSGQVLAVNYASKAESLAHGETQFQDLGILIREAFAETKGVNPFPASLKIYVDEDLITRKRLEQLVLGIKAYDEIEDVLLTGQGQLKDHLRDSERTILLAIGVAALLIWCIIGSVIRRTAAARASEIHLMKLLGMPRGHLLTPFIVHGVFLGGIGTLCGLGCFYGMFYIFKSQLGAVNFLPLPLSIAVVIGGMAIGVLAGSLAHRKFA